MLNCNDLTTPTAPRSHTASHMDYLESSVDHFVVLACVIFYAELMLVISLSCAIRLIKEPSHQNSPETNALSLL